MTVVKEPVVPRILSVQLALGTDHCTGKRDLIGQYAFTVLSLRHISTALVHTVSIKDLNRISTEAIHSLRPLVRWSIDLVIYIVDILLDIKRALNMDLSRSATQAFQEHIDTTSSPAIHLLLCSYSRALLRFQVSWIGKYIHIARQVATRAHSVIERQDLTAMYEDVADLPVKLQPMELLLAEFDAVVRNAYNPALLPADRRSDLEISMTCDGILPVELEPALDTLMRDILPKLAEAADQSRVYFWNTDSLQLGGRSKGDIRWDVIRRVQLEPAMKLRLCRRCGSEMEDLHYDKLRDMPIWLMHAQKHCICMNYWILP